MSNDHAYFYGVDGTHGGYLIPPPEAGGSAPPAAAPEPRNSTDAEFRPRDSPGRRYRSFDPNDPRFKRPERKKRFRGWVDWVDPENLGLAGWAVVFSHRPDPAVVSALEPLLELRRQQATAQDARRYKICIGDDGYRPGESAGRFLERHKAARGLADPNKFPYYVLLVGQPGEIPFSFQYGLNAQHAVGRVSFDAPLEYAAYAKAVVAAEREARSAERVPVAIFGTSHDAATMLSAEHLARNLEGELKTSKVACDVISYVGARATKALARRLIGGDLKPAVLFTASHGMAFARSDDRQCRHQGALLCPELPDDGEYVPSARVAPEHYLAASDIDDAADVSGLIAFLFGCYTAGTPCQGGTLGTCMREEMQSQQEFVARLPQRLLAHPGGSALAVIGHVDRAWSGSFWTHSAGADLSTFGSTLRSITAGCRVGRALEYFGQRLGVEAVALAEISQGDDISALTGDPLRDYEDARNYVLLGDPAVRLPPPKRRFRSWEPPPPR